MTGGSYDAAARRALESALNSGGALECPFCAVTLRQQEVARPDDVSYVRHRVWVLCPSCRRTATLDRRRA